MIVDERLTTYIDSLSWQIPEYLKEVEKEALADEVPVIRRSMQTLLVFLLQVRKPKAILEIGTAIGFSGMLMSEAAGEAEIDTIEKVPMRLKEAKRNFKKYGKTDRIHLYEGDAADVLQELSDKGKKYDFIFMDAAKGQYLNFLPFVLELLPEGGMLVTDNVLQDGDVIQSRYAVTRRDRTIHGRMREYLYLLTHSENLDTVILPVGDGVTLSVLKKERD
ncbi:MAG: O-methyltransferase [Lachnospiraceae bacterium]|nr:O-methyltransferase [Lachnospiraceae bacterium]